MSVDHFTLLPEYNQIYLKNDTLSNSEYLNWSSVKVDSGYHANKFEAAVFVEDIDVPVFKDEPIDVVIGVGTKLGFHIPMTKIYEGEFFCKEEYLVLCNPFTVKSEDRIKVEVPTLAGKTVKLSIYVDRTVTAKKVAFSLEIPKPVIAPPPTLS